MIYLDCFFHKRFIWTIVEAADNLNGSIISMFQNVPTKKLHVLVPISMP